MKKKLFQEIEIPNGVEIKLEDGILTIKGEQGENKRRINVKNLVFEVKDGKIRVGHEKATKKEKKQMNTIISHIKNMIKGVQEKFEYKLKICSSHFPMNVKAEGKEIIIKNFLGEKIDRKSKIPENVEVNIQGQEITLSSINKELVGQAAANLENATKIIGRDKRIFQDGIYIISKGGKEI